ncbi:MAG: EAL domain-containing protein [Holosporaceae bacterium]|jgi:EAL domain-containing protein (putative c-di-GMP-specific phosphodiesterase class I)|nr:EAL domain-containing protein [Holosporaceae bacterium]
MINKIRLQPLIPLRDNAVLGYEALYKKEDTADYPSAVDILASIVSSNAYKNNSRLFINMTVKDIVDTDFCGLFCDILIKNQIDGSNIVLEVSENTPPECLSIAKRTLSLLRLHNVKIALDDFGTNYSSLSFLNELPVDIVKVDKKFIQEAPSNRKSRALLKFCTDVSHDFGCEVVAEGIETQDQLDCGKDAGVDLGQGFFFSVPLHFRKKTASHIELEEYASLSMRRTLITQQCHNP